MKKQAKKRLFLLFGILTILIIALIFILFKVGLFAKPELTLIERGPYNYVYTEHSGSFQKVTEAHEKTEELVNKQEIKIIIPCGVYLNDPSSFEDDMLQWRVGYLVEDSVVVKQPLLFDTISRATYIVAKIKAPPAIAAFKTYPALERWVLDNNYQITGPAVELYYGNIVESMFPVKEKALD